MAATSTRSPVVLDMRVKAPIASANGTSPAPKRRTRVKSGCVTCRIRRVKCDEGRPACQRCTSTGRKCDGYPVLPMSRRDLPVALHNRKSLLLSSRQVTSVAGFADNTEMLYFDFFRSRTTPATNQYVACNFWERLVLQLSHDEPAVKHAVLAISALHQQWELYGSSAYEADSNAHLQYGKAVTGAKSLLERTRTAMQVNRKDVETVLAVCVLFVCFENLIGDYERASVHLVNGLQILASEGMQLSARGLQNKLELDIVELLNRFDFQAMTFSQAQFPLRKAQARFTSIPPSPLPERFNSISEMRIYLFEHTNWAIAVDEVLEMSRLGERQHPTKEPAEMLIEAIIEHSRVVVNLKRIWEMVEELVERRYIPQNPAFRSSAEYLYPRVHHRTISMVTKAGSTGFQKSWDACIPEMAVVLEELLILHKHTTVLGINTKSPLSLEVGVCVPLFVLGNKCRDPVLRRRFLNLLDSDQRKEGIWESFGAARVVERAILVEERRARHMQAELTGADPASIEITCADDVPEKARIQMYYVHVNMVKRVIHLKFAFRKGDGYEDGWIFANDKVEF